MMNERNSDVPRGRASRLVSVLAGSFGLGMGGFILLTLVFVVTGLDRPCEIMWKHMYASTFILAIACFPLASKLMTGRAFGALCSPAQIEAKRITCTHCGEEFPITHSQSALWPFFLLSCPHCHKPPAFAGKTHRALWITFLVVFILVILISAIIQS